MIRLSRHVEQLACYERYAHGCTVYAVGQYRLWLLRKISPREAPPVELAIRGPQAQLTAFYSHALDAGAKVREDGTVEWDGMTIRRDGLVGRAVPGYDILAGFDTQRVDKFNDSIRVYTNGVFRAHLTHFTSNTEELRERIEGLGYSGKITIRESDDGPVLHEWTQEAKTTAYEAFVNDNPVAHPFKSAFLHASAEWEHDAEAALPATTGDRVRVGDCKWNVGGMMRYGVQTPTQATNVLWDEDEPLDMQCFADAVGAKPGETFTYAWVGDGMWATHRLPASASYTANYRGFLSTARGFLSSKTDKSRVREDAIKVLGPCPGARLFIAANEPGAAFPQHYTEA